MTNNQRSQLVKLQRANQILKNDLEQAMECLMGMVAQHCTNQEGNLDSWALSANAESMRFLVEKCKVKLDISVGHRVVGKWIKNEKEIPA